MNKTDATKVLMVLQSCFPNDYKNWNETQLNITCQMWANSFQDMPLETVLNAVSQYAMKNQFPPAISQIRLLCVEMTNPNRPKTAQEAWEDVILGVKKFGYYRMDEAFNTLDDRTKRAVRVIGWQNICQSESVGIERANFIKFYDSYNADAKDKWLFPKALTDKITDIMSKQKQLEAGNDDENATAEM